MTQTPDVLYFFFMDLKMLWLLDVTAADSIGVICVAVWRLSRCWMTVIELVAYFVLPE
jgi:hypothetical protein